MRLSCTKYKFTKNKKMQNSKLLSALYVKQHNIILVIIISRKYTEIHNKISNTEVYNWTRKNKELSTPTMKLSLCFDQSTLVFCRRRTANPHELSAVKYLSFQLWSQKNNNKYIILHSCSFFFSCLDGAIIQTSPAEVRSLSDDWESMHENADANAYSRNRKHWVNDRSWEQTVRAWGSPPIL